MRHRVLQRASILRNMPTSNAASSTRILWSKARSSRVTERYYIARAHEGPDARASLAAFAERAIPMGKRWMAPT